MYKGPLKLIHLLSTYYVPGSVPGPEHVTVNKEDKICGLTALTF